MWGFRLNASDRSPGSHPIVVCYRSTVVPTSIVVGINCMHFRHILDNGVSEVRLVFSTISQALRVEGKEEIESLANTRASLTDHKLNVSGNQEI